MRKAVRTDFVIEGGKRYYKICKCGKVKERYKNSYCLSCSNEYSKKQLNKNNEKFLIEFVDRIERRGGIASMEDIFVSMITLYNYWGYNKKINALPTKIQLSIMWEFLKEKRKKIKYKKSIVEKNDFLN